jgi:acetone carboxylase gamma subunit
MTEIAYRCPISDHLLFMKDGDVIRIKCKCGQIVTPIAKSESVFQRTYRCTECERVQQTECPAETETYCIVCGTKTLETIDEVRPVREKAKVRR